MAVHFSFLQEVLVVRITGHLTSGEADDIIRIFGRPDAKTEARILIRLDLKSIDVCSFAALETAICTAVARGWHPRVLICRRQKIGLLLLAKLATLVDIFLDEREAMEWLGSGVFESTYLHRTP